MAYNFPNSPSNGDTVTVNGITYTYNSTSGAWKTTATSGSGGGASVTVSETAPSSPSEGDLWFDPSVLKTFVYYNDGTANQWVQSNPTGGGGASGGASVTVSETAPTSPSAGDLWWSSSEAVMYIYTDSSQWVSTSFTGLSDTPSTLGTAGQIAKVNSGGTALEFADQSGVTVYANVDALPSSGNAGDMAYVTATNRLYLWTGTGWYNIALINNNPTISGVSANYDLASDGTPTVITITATDPEGLPITYSIASDTSGNTATVTQGTGANTNVFTITPSTSTADAGTFSLTFRASDGVNIASAISEFTLKFKVQNSNYTTALITSVGTNNQVNNDFVDSSTNSHTITAAGNATQSTFSPYRHGGYSTYLTTNTSYVRSPTSADFDIGGTGDWAYEAWVYVPSSHSFATYARAFGLGPFYNNSKSFGLNISDGAHSNYITVYWDDASGLGRKLISSTTFDKGQWNHLLVARSGNSIGLFYNGTRIASDDSYTSAIDGGSTYLYVGHTGNGTEGSQEYIADLRFINGSHPYDASASSITVPSENLEEVANTKILLGQKPYLVDASSNGHALTTNGTITTEPFAPYEYETYSASEFGASASFASLGDHISGPSGSGIAAPGSGDFCIEFWIYPTIDSTLSTLVDYRPQNSSPAGLVLLWRDASNKVYFFANGSQRILADDIAPTNVWTHVALVRNSGTHYLYINGKQQTTTWTDSTTWGTNSSRPIFMQSGYHYSGNSPGNYYNTFGHMADARIVVGSPVYTADFTPPTAPLTAITNTALLLNGTNAGIIDKSQSVKTLTLAGDTKSSTAQTKYLSSSMYFDGTGDYIATSLNNNFSSKSYTIEGWFYPSINLTGRYSLFNVGSGTSATDRITIGVYDGTFFHQHEVGNSNTITVLSGGIGNYTLTSGQWHHFEMVFDWGGAYDSTSTGYIFMNGVLQETYRLSGHVATSIVELSRSDIAGGAKYFPGYISDFRVRQGIAAHTANFTPPTAALQG